MRTLRSLVFVAGGLACASGCSSQDSRPADQGPFWPDGLLDAGRDQRPPVDAALRPDGPRRRDGLLVDLGGADGDGGRAGWLPEVIAQVDLHAVSCVFDHVFAVGQAGTVLHRPPGGAFAAQSFPASADLHAVTFADSSYGAVAGASKEIWKTEDLGGTWVIAPQCGATLFDAFHGLHLHSATAGFGAGTGSSGAESGGAFKYFGGGSWVCGPTVNPGEVFLGVFRREDRGWLVGDSGGKIQIISQTADLLSWQLGAVSAGTSAVLRAVTFAGPQLGVAVGDQGTIVRSVDGPGEVWAAVSSGTAEHLRAVHFQDGQRGWAVGDNGTILHTEDGAATWKAQLAPTVARLHGVCFTSADEGWVVGEGGIALHTTSGGR